MAISVDALRRGKFGRLGHFIRHHGQSGSPVQHKLTEHNRHSRPLRPLPYGLKWPKKMAKKRQEAKQSLQKSARRLLCQDVKCAACITYYARQDGTTLMRTECPETTAGMKASLIHGICCEQDVWIFWHCKTVPVINTNLGNALWNLFVKKFKLLLV
mgnify:CR=1 FL=1